MAQLRDVPTADTDEEWQKLLSSDNPDIVRCREDWDRIAGDEEACSAILPGCDRATVEAFSEGLVFRNGGLAGADYSMLVDTLTISRFRNVWARFGIGPGLLADHDGYMCESRGNCKKTRNYICTSNC
jgi:hypothetical protein